MPKYFNLISHMGYSLVSDIVFSIEYTLSGSSYAEAGMSFMLTTESDFAGGAGSGDELGYLDRGDRSTSMISGVSGGVFAIGFDTHGFFGLKTDNCDGLSDLHPNYYAVRGGYENNYSMSAFNFTSKPLSGGYNIVSQDDIMRSIRFRIGNLGRTAYLDHRDDQDEPYVNFATVDIGDYLDFNSRYRIGMGFVTPIDGVEEADLLIRSIHIEGNGEMYDDSLGEIRVVCSDDSPTNLIYGGSVNSSISAGDVDSLFFDRDLDAADARYICYSSMYLPATRPMSAYTIERTDGEWVLYGYSNTVTKGKIVGNLTVVDPCDPAPYGNQYQMSHTETVDDGVSIYVYTNSGTLYNPYFGPT